MKADRILFILMLFFAAQQVMAQNLYEAMAGIKTDFIFTSNNEEIGAERQFLVKKSGVLLDYTPTSESSYGYGGGYESYHLEFYTRSNISVEHVYRPRPNYHYQLTFYDHQNNKISTIHFYRGRFGELPRVNVTEAPGMTYFSFDLRDLPIAVLEHTARIDVIKAVKR